MSNNKNYPNRPIPKAGILEIAPYKAGKSSIAGAPQNQKIHKLSSNESALGASPKAVAAYHQAADNLGLYPEGSGKILRQAIADYYNLIEQNIVCGAGSDEVISLLIHGYAGAGDEVIYSHHGFLMYRLYTLGAGAIPVAAAEKHITPAEQQYSNYSSYCADIDNIISKVTSRTKMVFIANPNNPTGSYLTLTELQRLRNGLRDDILLVIDGAYSEYVSKEQKSKLDYSDGYELVQESITNGLENTVMTHTFSKMFGLAALRVGWAYAPDSICDILHRIRGPFNVNGPAMLAAAASLQDDEFINASIAHNSHWLDWVSSEMAQLGYNVHDSLGNFVMVEFANAQQSSNIYQHLAQNGIIVREIGSYDLASSLRISIGTEEQNKALIAAMKSYESRG